MRGALRLFIFAFAFLAGSLQALAQTSAPEPYTIQVPNAVLKDLRTRLKNTRWPDQLAGTGWDYGTDTKYLRELVTYWANDYDWRATEKRLNALDHYRVNIDGLRIHYIYQKGSKPDSIPLLMMHGWPSSFVQFMKILPLLTDPAAHGAPDAPSFDVVIVSLPGYGFSDIPQQPGGLGTRATAERMTKLMSDVLGYQRFAVRGSDVGGSVLQQMGLAHPEKLIGAHTSGLLRVAVPPTNQEPSAAEKKFQRDLQTWQATEMGYSGLHATKPQTLAPALNDSPAGLASWIIEKFRRWADTNGNIESRFSKDELLTNLTIYWVTQTAPSSIRLYYEYGREQRLTGRVTVPTAVLMGMHDQVPPPREVVDRMYNVVRWNESAAGGHFLEWEEPERVARDLREFFGELSSGDKNL